MNTKDKETIREALKVYQDESFFLPEAQGDTIRFEIRNALAALEQPDAPRWTPVPNGEYQGTQDYTWDGKWLKTSYKGAKGWGCKFPTELGWTICCLVKGATNDDL